MSRTSQTNQFESGIVMQRVRGCELFATGSSFLDLVKVRDDFLAPLSRKDNVRGRNESFYIRGAAGLDGRAGCGPIPRNLGIVACR
jgi:hypothetical protein